MSLVFDTSLYMNGGAGGGVSLDKIIVKSATIPTAAVKYVGAVYQYVGETNSTYTHGYIYECKEDVTYDGLIGFEPAKIGFDYTKGNLIEFLSSITPDFANVVGGSFTYSVAGDIWTINGIDSEGNTVFDNYKLYTPDLEDEGFVFLYPAQDYEDGEVVEYYLNLTPSSTYAWERIDVQPGATRGRFLALWNCATGLAESNPPSSPYPYATGDYYIVGTVGTTNYKPSGSSYVIGTASTTVETGDVAVNDTYYYDGTNWNLQKNTATTVDQNYDPTSTNAQSGTAVAQAIAGITIPTVNNATLTITQGGVSKGTFTANAGTDVTIALDSGVSIDNTTITKNGSDQLQASAVMNARTGTDVMPIWQGTEQQWTNGVGTDWYNWKSDAVASVSSTNFPNDSTWFSILYGNGQYLITSSQNTTVGSTSNNLLTWTPVTLPADIQAYGYKYFLNNTFILFSAGGTNLVYSTDLQNWSTSQKPQISGADSTIDIAYGDGKYLAAQWDGNSSELTGYFYSTDLQNWTRQDLPKSVVCSSLKYLNNQFVMTGSYTSNGSTVYTILTSSTGLNNSWTRHDLDFQATRLYTLMYGDGIYTCITDDTCYYSYDLDTWSSKPLPIQISGSKFRIMYNNGMFISGSRNGTDIIYSSNGIDWAHTTVSSGTLIDMCVGDDAFVSLGNTTGNIITFSQSQCYTLEAEPTTASTVYSEPNTASALTITSVGTGTITLSDNNTYTYTQSGDEVTYQSIGEAHPTWLCNINGVGVKVGNTLVADYTTLDNVPTQGSTNGITSGAVYSVLGDLETALHNINSGS